MNIIQATCKFMKSKMESTHNQDNAVRFFDVILSMLQYSEINLSDVLTIGAVCNLWARLADDDNIWQRLFYRRFLFPPSSFFKPQPNKISYKQQLAYLKLEAAIEFSNVSAISALLAQGKRINCTYLVGEDSDSLSTAALCIERYFKKIMQLPKPLCQQLLSGDHYQYPDGEHARSFTPLHALTLLGRLDFIKEVFDYLDDMLYSLISIRYKHGKEDRFFDADMEIGNFIDIVATYGTIGQLNLILSALGDNASKLLAQQVERQEGIAYPSSIHYAARWLEPEKFALMLNYLKPEDQDVLLQDSCTYTLPFITLANRHFTQLLSIIFNEIWSPESLVHNLLLIDRDDMSVLHYLIDSGDNEQSIQTIRFIIDAVGRNYNELINQQDAMGDNLIEYAVVNCFHEDVHNILTILAENDRLDMAYAYYHSLRFNEDLQINPFRGEKQQIIEVFHSFDIGEKDHHLRCTLL